MSLADAKVTLNYSDVAKLQGDAAEANDRVRRLEAELVEAKLGDHSNLTRQYREAFHEAMVIVRFAVGNLEPLTVRGWPYKELYSIVEKLKTMPGVDKDQAETANDLKLFASGAEKWETARAEGREKALLAEENSARAPINPTQ